MSTCIFIDMYLGSGRSAVALTLIFGLVSLDVRVVCGAFGLGGGSWVRGCGIEVFVGLV